DEAATSKLDEMRAHQDPAQAVPARAIGRTSPLTHSAVQADHAPQGRPGDGSRNDVSHGAAGHEHGADPDTIDAALRISAAGELPLHEEMPLSSMASGMESGRTTAVPLAHIPARVAQISATLNEPGARAVRLRLDPPSLGEVRLHIESSAQGITVRIVAQSQ